jgi:site-specific recombinase XerD
VIQEMLGHSSLNLTMNIYAHVLPSMQIEAREKMKGFFQKIPEQVHEKTQENGDQKGKKEGYTV